MCAGIGKKALFFAIGFLLVSLCSSKSANAQPAFGSNLTFKNFQFRPIQQSQVTFPTSQFKAQNTRTLQFETLQFPSFATPVVPLTTSSNQNQQQTLRPFREAPQRPRRAAYTGRNRTLSSTRVGYSSRTATANNRRRPRLSAARQQVAQAARSRNLPQARQIVARPTLRQRF